MYCLAKSKEILVRFILLELNFFEEASESPPLADFSCSNPPPSACAQDLPLPRLCHRARAALSCTNIQHHVLLKHSTHKEHCNELGVLAAGSCGCHCKSCSSLREAAEHKCAQQELRCGDEELTFRNPRSSLLLIREEM